MKDDAHPINDRTEHHQFERELISGRGAQQQQINPFSSTHYVSNSLDGLDEEIDPSGSTIFLEDKAKKAISKNNSPDLFFDYSINPYQGCEHGCIYCYARNSHAYWGYNAGLDFEKKIIVKHDIAALLETELNKPNYQPAVIMLSGNTDCYQPIERKLGLTRSLLQVFLKYQHPVSLITKNTIIDRDLDLLEKLAERQLVHVAITINSLNEELRRKMEPRTATAKRRLQTIAKLRQRNIPVSLMCAPIIPGLNDHEIPQLIKEAAQHGAQNVHYTLVRLNGALSEVFEDWIRLAYPDRANKVLNLIASCHEGKVNDNRWGKRMRGDGQYADQIAQLVKVSRRKYMNSSDGKRPVLRTDLFAPNCGRQLPLF